MKVDKQFESLLFPLSDDEFSTLEKNIISGGCRDPLVIWKEEDILLDGHNRLRICTKHKIDFKEKRISLPDRTAALDWIDSNQLGRRNLSPDMMRLIRGRLYNRTKKETTDGGKGTPKGTVDQNAPRSTAAHIAKASGVSAATVKRDAKFAEQVEKDSSLLSAIKNREPVKNVLKEKRKQQQIDREEKAVAKIDKKEKKWVVTDCEDVILCDALITDPPYGILSCEWEPEELETFTRRWVERWSTCGADIILIFFSQRFMWAGRQWFDESLSGYDFQQLLVWVYKNNKSPQSKMGFKQIWEPIFMYRKKESKKEISVGAGSWGEDLHDMDAHLAAVPQSNFNDADMKQHPAQKPVSAMRWLINATTRPNDLVCDPFCGSGTTGIASMQLGRRFHGIEIDEQFRVLSERRIAEYGRI